MLRFRARLLTLATLMVSACLAAGAQTPLRLGIVGLTHGHAGGFFSGGALAPAGSILSRPEIQLVGIVEPSQPLFDAYAKRYKLSPALHFASLADMAAHAHPQAVLVLTSPSEHRRVVEESAALGIHVMMEKPLAITYADALAIGHAAETGHIHVLVDYETSWYPSNAELSSQLAAGTLGPVVKAVFRDGHQGPAKIGVGPEFLSWLTDPKLGGDGALVDFGCYGPDLMTSLLHGEAPQSVTAVTRHLQPEVYPNVSDEVDMTLVYAHTTALVQGSWDWPFALKQMDLYGRTGFASAVDSGHANLREKESIALHPVQPLPLAPPFDDPLHYFAAVIAGKVQEGDSLSALKTNITVTEILDAAHRSATTGRSVTLPLQP